MLKAFYFITASSLCLFFHYESTLGQQVGGSVKGFEHMFNIPYDMERDESDADLVDVSPDLDKDGNIKMKKEETDNQDKKIRKRYTEIVDDAITGEKLERSSLIDEIESNREWIENFKEPTPIVGKIIKKRSLVPDLPSELPEIPSIPTELPEMPSLPSELPKIPGTDQFPSISDMKSKLPSIPGIKFLQRRDIRGLDIPDISESSSTDISDLKFKSPSIPDMKVLNKRQLGNFGGNVPRSFNNAGAGLQGFGGFQGFQIPSLPNFQNLFQNPARFFNNLGLQGRRRRDLGRDRIENTGMEMSRHVPRLELDEMEELSTLKHANIDNIEKKINNRPTNLDETRREETNVDQGSNLDYQEDEIKQEKKYNLKKYADDGMEKWKKVQRDPTIMKQRFKDVNDNKSGMKNIETPYYLLALQDKQNNKIGDYVEMELSKVNDIQGNLKTRTFFMFLKDAAAKHDRSFGDQFLRSRKLMSTSKKRTPILAKQEKEVIEEVEVNVKKTEIELDQNGTTSTTESSPEDEDEYDFSQEAGCPNDLITVITSKFTCLINGITSRAFGIEISPDCCT